MLGAVGSGATYWDSGSIPTVKKAVTWWVAGDTVCRNSGLTIYKSGITQSSNQGYTYWVTNAATAYIEVRHAIATTPGYSLVFGFDSVSVYSTATNVWFVQTDGTAFGGTGNNHGLAMGTSGILSVYENPPSGAVTTSYNGTNLANCIFIYVRHSDGTGTLYRNGTQVGTNAAQSTYTGTGIVCQRWGNLFSSTQRPSNNTRFRAALVYDYELSSAEIAELTMTKICGN